jgi:prepilin-type N-terminal cleavage/methylation domain-containing protein
MERKALRHRSQRAARTTPRPRPRRDGFTMVEVIVAMVVLAFGVLGLAGTTAYIVRQVTLADITTERAAALQTVVERIQAMDWDSVDTGIDSVGIYGVSWSSVALSTQLKEVTVITNGPGLRTSVDNPFPVLVGEVADTFSIKVIRP